MSLTSIIVPRWISWDSETVSHIPMRMTALPLLDLSRIALKQVII